MTNPASVSEKLKPRLRVRITVVASSLTVALLIFEVFLRAIGFTYPVFYQPDEVRGYALRPGMEGVAKLDTGKHSLLWIGTRRIRDQLRHIARVVVRSGRVSVRFGGRIEMAARAHSIAGGAVALFVNVEPMRTG